MRVRGILLMLPLCLVLLACGRSEGARTATTASAAAARVANAVGAPVDASTVSPSETVTETPTPTRAAAAEPAAVFQPTSAVIALGTTSRSGPSMTTPAVRQLAAGGTVQLASVQYGENWIIGTQDWVPVAHDWERVWYRLDDGSYVYRAFVLLASDGVPSERAAAERYVLVDLGRQTAWAMEGGAVVRTMPITTGKSGFETPAGEWSVISRVANERMTSSSAGFDSPSDSYDVQRVLYTQYFAEGGFALHLNYWQPTAVFGGYPTSHGCIGLRLPDAQFLWLFGSYSMRVIVRQSGGATPVASRPPPVPVATPAATVEVAQAPAFPSPSPTPTLLKAPSATPTGTPIATTTPSATPR